MHVYLLSFLNKLVYFRKGQICANCGSSRFCWSLTLCRKLSLRQIVGRQHVDILKVVLHKLPSKELFESQPTWEPRLLHVALCCLFRRSYSYKNYKK